MLTIHPIELPALPEGFLFIERLWKEWESGENRFAASGETLCGCMDQGALVAIGGLNQDLFDVRPAWRKKSTGQALVHVLVEHARSSFNALHLRTNNPTAARLYERLGFSRSQALNATHTLDFD